MKKVIIRDDDISYFTHPRLLDQIYGPIWDRGIPVCLSVIPAHNGASRLYNYPGNPIEPSIAPQYRGQNKEFSITDNPVLCGYLNDKAKQGLVEICLHGYNHTYIEFTSHDVTLTKQKLEAGRAILRRAIPDALIYTFIPPHGRISPMALQQVIDLDFNICTHSANLILPQLQGIDNYRREPLPNGRQIYTCDEYLFNNWSAPEEVFQLSRQRLMEESLLIITNHYWMFYNNWDELNSYLLDYLYRFLNEVLNHPDASFTTFRAG